MADRSLDRDTLDAIGVLARAVDHERIPGVPEFRLLSNALRRAIDFRSEEELDEAARLFQTMDSDSRARIVERATVEARASRSNAVTVESPPLPAATGRPILSAPRSAGSSFLSALNGLRPGRAKDSSRSAAKDRLRAAVETQRALPESGFDARRDPGCDTDLRPGDPLPRSA
ncbi:hypothetical protein [Azospirillum sp.]|uniref:hypothetical protein n=1 Tax=Azospirillum sp. TaxID=34012 RepID=UPI00261EE011|nr:hypothetical protein [Azospirillum sp.]